MNWIDPFGDIFIKLLKLIAVPLVLFSIIKGVTGISDGSSLGRLGMKTLVAYLITTVLSISIGLMLVNSIQPGTSIPDEQRVCNRLSYETWAEENTTPLADSKKLTGTLSNEQLAACNNPDLMNRPTASPEDVAKRMATASKTKSAGPLQFIVDMVPGNFNHAMSDGNGKPSMLQIIFFAIFFGVVLLFIDQKKAKPVIDLIDGLNEVFLKMVDVVMQAAPFFVFALMAGKMLDVAGGDVNNLMSILASLGRYAITLVIGLGAMVFIIYPLFVQFATKGKVKYMDFMRSIAPAQLLAFSTSSSAATLPVTMDCVRENLKVSDKITDFVLPIGATVNMDGTSMYQAVAAIFLAQMYFVDLSMSAQLTIVLTATLASIGSAAVPGAGLVMLVLVLDSVGLPGEWIALIIPIDRILDMCRTVVNVTGDATVSTVIAQSEGELHFDGLPVVKNFDV